ncbi:MAG: (2Fe-2S)-binding protein [Vicinamibacterales bacterium]
MSSPILVALADARALEASWSPDVGIPAGPGWIAGADLQDASSGPFNALLLRIGERAGTRDRRTIAASFALRYGWSSGMVIAPYVRSACVPDVSLDNVSFKFKESTFLERTAIHEARGVVGDSSRALLAVLRQELANQAAPVVEALYTWAGFSRRGTWGLLTSAWAAHVTGLFDGVDQREVWPALDQLFGGDDLVALMKPRFHAVTYRNVTHLYQRRASCCRWYLLPRGELCTSCPLVPHEERLMKNLAWMEQQLGGSHVRTGHT